MLVRGMLGVLLGTGLLQFGCGGCGPEERCHTYWFDQVIASSSSSSLSVAEGEAELQPVELIPVGDDLVPGACVLVLRVPTGGACYHDGEDVAEVTQATLACTIGGGHGFTIYPLDLGDLRWQGVGTHEVADVPLTYSPSGQAAASPGCVQLVVEEAVGGPLPYPDVVSQDYLRVLRMEFDCDFPGDGGVSPSVHVVGEATFTISVDNYDSTTMLSQAC